MSDDRPTCPLCDAPRVPDDWMLLPVPSSCGRALTRPDLGPWQVADLVAAHAEETGTRGNAEWMLMLAGKESHQVYGATPVDSDHLFAERAAMLEFLTTWATEARSLATVLNLNRG